MTPVRCTACKKYYDSDKYDVCPHCSNAGAPGGTVRPPQGTVTPPTPPVTPQTQGKRPRKTGGFFSGKGKTDRHSLSLQNGVIPSEDPDILAGTSRSVSAERSENRSVTGPSPLAPATSGQRGGHVQSMEPVQPSHAKTPSVQPQLPQDSVTEDDNITSAMIMPNQPEQSPEPVAQEQTPPPIGVAVQQAASTQDDSKTIGIYNIPNTSGAPVVGWLVCIQGESVGECFNIRSGRNSVGRSLSMDISLSKEKSVSRERHCSITFEPHQKQFFIQAGESSGLTYVNDELLMTFRPLSDYDVILLGKSKFLFLRLVNDKFSWDDYID